MRKITQAIGAGETVYLPMCKSFMLIETADYDCSFYFYGKNNQLNKEIANFKDIFTVNAGENEYFMKVGVFSASAQSIDVVLLDDDRVLYNKMAGSVSVTSSASSPIFVNTMGKYFLSMAEKQFKRVVYAATTVNNYSHLSLWNKTTSPNMVILEKCDFTTEYTTEIGHNFSARTTVPGAFEGAGYNLYCGKSTSQGELYSSHGTSLPTGSDVDKGRWCSTSAYNNARGLAETNFDAPLIIPPGYMANFVALTKNCWFRCGFQWREEVI